MYDEINTDNLQYQEKKEIKITADKKKDVTQLLLLFSWKVEMLIGLIRLKSITYINFPNLLTCQPINASQKGTGHNFLAQFPYLLQRF